jgi:putative transposase
VGTLYVEPGSLWENGYEESFSGKVRDEFLNLEQFAAVLETPVLANRFKKHYNTSRPHNWLDYRPPTPAASAPWPPSARVPAAHMGRTSRLVSPTRAGQGLLAARKKGGMAVSRRSFLRYCGASAAALGLSVARFDRGQESAVAATAAGGNKTALSPFPGVRKSIPFSLNDRRGSVTVSYGKNEDPILAGFDSIPGLTIDIALSRGYPVVHAVIDAYQGSGYRTFCGWLQIVTRTLYDSYDTGQTPVESSASADVAPSMDDLGSPFASFGNLPQFFDAPCRNLYGHAQLRWVADTFLTTVPKRSRDEEISRLLGFRWGYVEYDTPEQRPVSLLPLEVTEAQAWNALLPFLRKEFPKWRFGSG